MKACIYENGKIFTSDKENLYAEAMLTEDGVIRKVGSREEVEKLAPQDCERVDLQGRRVIPGFVDAHMHPLMLADYSRQISALPPKIRSIEELIQAADLTKEQYSGVDLEQFIEDFSVTKEDVNTLNIPLLLKEYEPDYKGRVIDVSYLLEDDIESRTSDFTSDAIAIAFMENKNTSTECVYYDLLQDRRYQTSDAYLFDNLYQTQAGYYSNGQQILQGLDKYKVFTWESKTDEEEITDPQSMVLAIEYADGTVFRIEASGLLSQVLPGAYKEVREMLLSGEYNKS